MKKAEAITSATTTGGMTVTPESLKAMKIWQIARVVKSDWQKVYFGAVPYLSAMNAVSEMNDTFGAEDGRTQVLYFLSNATTWKGDVAKLVKIELNRRLKAK